MIHDCSRHRRTWWQLAVLPLYVSFMLPTEFAGATESNEKRFSSIATVQSERESLYANAHFVWHETDEVGSDVTETRFESWARGSQFYRLDSYKMKDRVREGSIRRVIARPEGTTMVLATEPNDPDVHLAFAVHSIVHRHM